MWHLDHLGLQSSFWQHTRGAGVRVAVLDSGTAFVDGLETPRVHRYDEDGGETLAGDSIGHGTAVASLIASSLPEALGVAPEVELLSYDVHGFDRQPRPFRVARALRKAVREGCDVVCCSFTLPDLTDELTEAIEAAHDASAFLVTATGNDVNTAADFPEAFDQELFVVGAVDVFADPLPGARVGPWTDLFAPGEEMTVSSADGYVADDFDGSSAAAPVVAGVAALGLARAQQLGGEDYRKEVATHLGPWMTQTARRRTSWTMADFLELSPVSFQQRIEERRW